jgi:hypothetical protein
VSGFASINGVAESGPLTVATDKDDDNGDKILKPLSEIATVYQARGHPRSAGGSVREVRVSANTDGRHCEPSNDITPQRRSWRCRQHDVVAGGDTEEPGSCSDMFRR